MHRGHTDMHCAAGQIAGYNSPALLLATPHPSTLSGNSGLVHMAGSAVGHHCSAIWTSLCVMGIIAGHCVAVGVGGGGSQWVSVHIDGE